MKRNQFAVVGIIFAFILSLGMLGGTWQTSMAHGTVPSCTPRWPTWPPIFPTPKVTITPHCVWVYVKKLGWVKICFPFHTTFNESKVKMETSAQIPGSEQIKPLSQAFNVTIDDVNAKKDSLKFPDGTVFTQDLSPETLWMIKKDSAASLMRYDAASKKWVKVPSKIENHQVSADISTPGLYVLAIPK